MASIKYQQEFDLVYSQTWNGLRSSLFGEEKKIPYLGFRGR